VRFDGAVTAAQLDSYVGDLISALDSALNNKLVMLAEMVAILIWPTTVMPAALYHAAARAFDASRCEQIDLIASESFGNTRTRGWFAKKSGTPSSDAT
jgi:hypothetical protein